jgi:hypothetical protein
MYNVVLRQPTCNLSFFTWSRLKGQCHEIFCFISLPQAPEYTIRAVSNFFENSRRYSKLKVDHRYQRHRWQICHRYQRHRRQILPPVLLVLLIPVANNGNNIRLQIPLSELEGKNVPYICVNSTIQRCPN